MDKLPLFLYGTWYMTWFALLFGVNAPVAEAVCALRIHVYLEEEQTQVRVLALHGQAKSSYD